MSVVVPMEHDEHMAVQALLPWYARGRLDAAQASEVQAHLLDCAACRAELAAEEPMQTLLQVAASPAESGDVEAGLARLQPRLRPHPAAPRPARWMPWALGLQGMAVAALLTLWLQARQDMPDYQGLAAAGSAPVVADALVMFKPGTSERQLRELLRAHGAGVVAGPTETGAWLLHVDARGLAALRAAPIVQMAEPLQPGPPR